MNNYILKVETHNHPTAIAPYSGAATGAGGEIRDESATGRGGKPKASLTGFAVSNLNIPGFKQPWEKENGKPTHNIINFIITLGFIFYIDSYRWCWFRFIRIFNMSS